VQQILLSKPDKPALAPKAPPCDLECFIKVSSIAVSTGHLFPGTKDLATLMAPFFNKSVNAYAMFRYDARTGYLGKTAQLSVSYMDHIWLVLQLTKAVKTNNFLLYARCLFLMCGLFFSFGGQNYARYLKFSSESPPNISTMAKAHCTNCTLSWAARTHL
jgi:hypothetical protein